MLSLLVKHSCLSLPLSTLSTFADEVWSLDLQQWPVSSACVYQYMYCVFLHGLRPFAGPTCACMCHFLFGCFANGSAGLCKCRFRLHGHTPSIQTLVLSNRRGIFCSSLSLCTGAAGRLALKLDM